MRGHVTRSGHNPYCGDPPYISVCDLRDCMSRLASWRPEAPDDGIERPSKVETEAAAKARVEAAAAAKAARLEVATALRAKAVNTEAEAARKRLEAAEQKVMEVEAASRARLVAQAAALMQAAANLDPMPASPTGPDQTPAAPLLRLASTDLTPAAHLDRQTSERAIEAKSKVSDLVVPSNGARREGSNGARREEGAVFDVTLIRRYGDSFGLGIGFDEHGAALLLRIRPDSPASACGQLRVHDRIVAVADIRVTKETNFGEVLKACGLTVRLTVARSHGGAARPPLSPDGVQGHSPPAPPPLAAPLTSAPPPLESAPRPLEIAPPLLGSAPPPTPPPLEAPREPSHSAFRRPQPTTSPEIASPSRNRPAEPATPEPRAAPPPPASPDEPLSPQSAQHQWLLHEERRVGLYEERNSREHEEAQERLVEAPTVTIAGARAVDLFRLRLVQSDNCRPTTFDLQPEEAFPAPSPPSAWSPKASAKAPKASLESPVRSGVSPSAFDSALDVRMRSEMPVGGAARPSVMVGQVAVSGEVERALDLLHDLIAFQVRHECLLTAS